MIDPNEPGPDAPAARDKPWLMRTYAGHSSARESNALFRRNLAKGQTGLSVAFDLPTQTGYDADHVLARGEVGRVGVPVGHLGDMRALFDGIPLERTNTSMTINATAMWLLALYQVVAEEQRADISRLTGTTQNDIIKEYLSRGTYIFPPGPSVRLATVWSPIQSSSGLGTPKEPRAPKISSGMKPRIPARPCAPRKRRPSLRIAPPTPVPSVKRIA